MRQLLLDTETTGFEPKEGHRIIEFAALEMVDRRLTGNSLHLYFNPERDIPIEATNVHGITIAQVQNEPVFKDRVEQIIEFIAGADLIIHNAKFDLNFLNHHFSELSKKPVQHYISSVIDTLMMARNKFPGSKNSLDALCDRFNVDRSNRDYHGALIDCELLGKVYLALTREQVSLLAETNESAKSTAQNFVRANVEQHNLAKAHVSDAELAAHLAYLQQLDQSSGGDCLWYNHNK